MILFFVREENGKPITLFFDMDGCGLSNMDLEFIKYLIGILKQYYPYFLNYIMIFEMAWILNGKGKRKQTKAVCFVYNHQLYSLNGLHIWLCFIQKNSSFCL